MRTKLTCLFVIICFVANAQFSIQPQIGLENSRTTVMINELPKFVPLGLQYAPRIALRMDYKFKKGHGPFVGVATSSPVVGLNFTDPQTANTSFYTTKQDLQIRFEGGYQVSTKPIYFSKPTTEVVTRTMYGYTYSAPKNCGSEQKVSTDNSGCRHYGQRTCRTTVKTTSLRKVNQGWFMRIVPSAGIAMIPTIKNDVEATQNNYSYKAGAWNTALITGAGFEFGQNKRTKFVVNINYLKGLGNLDTKTISNISNGKSTTTSFKSSTSSWNVNVGIPISFTKQKSDPLIKPCNKNIYHSGCQHYHSTQQ